MMSDEQEKANRMSPDLNSSAVPGDGPDNASLNAADGVFAQAASDGDPIAQSSAVQSSAVQSSAVQSSAVQSSAAQAELDDARQKYVRLQAELENFRKRMMRSMEEERRYADLPLLRDLLPVVDNLQRAITAAEKHENVVGLLEGVLQRHHCTPIEALDTPFDPHLHEAIAQHPSPTHAPGHVCLVTQVGYQLHDRVIRPAQVIVAAAPPSDAGAALPDPEI